MLERVRGCPVAFARNVPLNVTVDYGWSWTEYQQLLSLWEEADGVMPLTPTLDEEVSC
jgi:hypothetical protein